MFVSTASIGVDDLKEHILFDITMNGLGVELFSCAMCIHTYLNKLCVL